MKKYSDLISHMASYIKNNDRAPINFNKNFAKLCHEVIEYEFNKPIRIKAIKLMCDRCYINSILTNTTAKTVIECKELYDSVYGK